MTNTHFSDPAGLDDQNAFSTATDLIKLVRHAVGYDLIAELLTTQAADVTSTDGRISHHLINTNQLLGQISSIIVGKTGYTDSALGTMVLEVGIDTGGERLISVVLGSNNRFGETRKLIEWGKKAYSWE
jgi:D-alanyl-D-alanine carboxypeptidase